MWATPLTPEEFARYGDVIAVPKTLAGDLANQGTAKRFNFLSKLVNLRSRNDPNANSGFQGPDALLNICIFRTQPATIPFSVKLLERHQYSTQMFIPMTNSPASYLVIVALNDPIHDRPDFSTLRAFWAQSTQAFNYHPNVWHHPMVGLQSQIDFVCFVFERRENQTNKNEDTEEVFFPKAPIPIRIASFESKL
jgi:ureidoglycolate hydrolase